MGWQGFFVVGVGAAIGAWTRWGLSLLLNATFPLLPLGTLVANLFGAFLMGIAMGLITLDGALSPQARLLITTGFLGGLTTFSTFSAESTTLFTNGQYGWAVLHMGSHVVGSITMTFLGFYLFNIFKG